MLINGIPFDLFDDNEYVVPVVKNIFRDKSKRPAFINFEKTDVKKSSIA